ncbi:DUF6090 family protein [Ichthyenterobacterium sp. W332]|uniref:DUF6090 family protein n=1 Tax=Microcosmobacter mediterraneus TaxID=3075607 RepID=A0ABU2YJE6_9FLAO|nr:DUF6090 family protein [Ichthyenterobacterium sp. W332]MDT0558290.1 DUF6090 family protein [Ichthyenterobacterium sp. W332]
MIKFFRHIRRSLINQNNMGKYFKYAIGEILLVVIGILIALQINNWNENRKLEHSKHKLMLALKKELVSNKNELDNYQLGIHKSNSKFNKVLLYSVGDYSIPIDSLKYYLSEMIYGRTLLILNSVQEEAINSGKFEMLSDSLKQNLSVLKDYTNSRNTISDRSTNMFNLDNDNESVNLMARLYMLPVIPEEFLSHPLIPTHPEFLLSDIELSALVKDPETYLTLNKIYLIYAADEVWIKYGLLRLTNETIALIDRELK